MARGLEEWLAPRRDGRPLQLGVLGGTFDPIHIGHLVAAEAARTHFRLDRVLFVPAGRPPHKDPAAVSDAEHRYRMTVLATAGNPYFYTTRLELDREGPSYTIDTLRQLSAMAGPEATVYFIAGADSVVTLPSWRGGLGLLDACQLIVVTRPGLPGEALQRFLDSLPAARRARVHLLPIPEIGISSTDLRERVAAGRSIRYLVPAAVEDYVHKYGLYRPRGAGAGSERAGEAAALRRAGTSGAPEGAGEAAGAPGAGPGSAAGAAGGGAGRA
ncbi:nicotinate (nicotinamide) nucleotide adenylyltransferase [Thermaerobacter marianensis DSM 12885]|uniref:Probable nicotinate-nucleotide adenylyltransferase n=1 Tax=Thermaerobacter marianensis (strain ATCC 700841 / DSM 12885 / JCM 10246 / 7p75a) TaxID=644966 RepID=E6SKC3_THEM7|nr:nicotinate-nucleotide adenylyltransferase [Thermaerobacter marianensis]ADU52281.1 nicotinate (nicotinamide) nucleotide adenylyltransferase [Thermaerobacter marianensis DSM 12885]